MYIQTKKVVIIFIVTVISFSSIIYNLYQQLLIADKLAIAIISSEELSFNNSYAQKIFYEISFEMNDEDVNESINSNIFQVSSDRDLQLKNAIESNDTNIIYGDNFNQYLVDLIELYPDKQFILIDNSITYDYANVYQINLDYTELFDAINRVSTIDSPSLVILSNEYSTLGYDTYLQSSIATNTNVKLQVVSNSSDNVAVKEEMLTNINDGFADVFVVDPYNNQVIIDAINSLNQEIDTYNTQLEQAEESAVNSEETSSTTTTEETSEVVEQPKENVHLNYLTFDTNEYIKETQTEYIKTYGYSINEEIKKVINNNLLEKRSKGKKTVTISSMQ